MRSKPSSAMRLLLCSSVVFTSSAAVIRTPLEQRADPPVLEDCQVEIQNEMANDLGRVNTDGTAGIGAEFETPEFYFETTCSAEDTFAAKGKVVADRTGTNWKLTADSGSSEGKLYAEYIIDGVQVKVGSTDDATNGAKVAAALAQDLIDWYPWSGDSNSPARQVMIAENKCNPWKIMTNKNTRPEGVTFQAQITAGMPLEALYSLMKENFEEADDRNVLNGFDREDGQFLMFVTKEHFQSSPGGISQEMVTDDVLAFCTLVLSYAKVAKENPTSSPKLYTTFMPRTNFHKIFSQVSSKLPAKGDDLWSLFNILACYKRGSTEIDGDYCGGTPESPQPSGNKFGGLTYSRGEARCNIKDWIRGLDPESQDKDALTQFDEVNDGSIGALGTTQEKMFNSERSVPLFEFRDLDYVPTDGMEDFMRRVDQAIQDLHNNFANAPGKRVRRGVCDNREPEPQPEPEPEPTGPTKQLAVLSSFVVGAPTLDWLFLEADYQQGVECREDFLRPFDTEPWDFSGNGAQAGSTFPGGTRELDLEIDGQKCQYQNDGDDPGALWCGERVIGCINDPADKDPEDANSDKGNYMCGDYTRQPVFVCPW
ncbi:hypothetical protein J4E91_005794 [Alternaria rosae]|nr:hypothetical protein J4E91_005794 [Alternaria rosae]